MDEAEVIRLEAGEEVEALFLQISGVPAGQEVLQAGLEVPEDSAASAEAVLEEEEPVVVGKSNIKID